MAKVLIKKLDPKVVLPAYNTNGASGMDLMAFIEAPIKIAPNSSYLVPTGFSMAFSGDYEVQIRPRSGLAAKSCITVLNTPGTIDSDYRGEIKVILFNHGKESFLINNKVPNNINDDLIRKSLIFNRSICTHPMTKKHNFNV